MVPLQHEIKMGSPLEHAMLAVRALGLLVTPGSTPLRHFVLMAPSERHLDEIGALLESWHQARWIQCNVHYWSPWDYSPFSPVATSLNPRRNRLQVLKSLSPEGEAVPTVILTTPEAWIQPTIHHETYLQSVMTLTAGKDVGSLEGFSLQLRELGYQKSEWVDEPGQFSLRGEICDLFDPSLPQPIRIEFFDTQIERIRPFHPESQRTQNAEALELVRVGPAEEVLIPWKKLNPFLETLKNHCDQNHISRKIRDPIFENIRSGYLPEQFRTWLPFLERPPSTLFDFLKLGSLSQDTVGIGVIDSAACKERAEAYLNEQKTEAERYQAPHWIAPSFSEIFNQSPILIEQIVKSVQTASSSIAQPPAWSQLSARAIEPGTDLKDRIYEWIQDGLWVLLGARGVSHQDRIRHFLGPLTQNKNLVLFDEDPGQSLEFDFERTVVISESLLFGKTSSATKKPARSRFKDFQEGETALLTQIQDLKPGDFVVHTLHGVGKFQGLHEMKSTNQNSGEYLLIEYQGGDKLFLPVYRLDVIQRYVGAGATASLDRLGSQQFEKAKQKARDSAKKLAVNLIEIYAKRALLKGAKFYPPDDSYEVFCDQFEFNETEGQAKASQDILNDLSSGKLLDRLVCGDVGFGKTEVAIRAAFQAIHSGFQVAVLVPTTLLAFQHEQSFKRRMASLPIRIELLSRFKNKKMQSEILKDLAEGKIDIIIGTHRLLSKDVRFQRLGLLVVDEEHRFGVDHKEKIKSLQANTHTLTLTATPIPRTLNLALSGLKDISIIKTPPTNRQPIKTIVSQYSEELIKSAIEQELSRGGQIFYLFNRVQGIEARAQEVRDWFPHAKVIVAHGQMTEDEIESRMLEFYQGHAQILVCTTIIESGIDVPNAGTILIHRADQLGLAQLYQIRGRVGRSHRKAYAYLLTDGEGVLTKESKMRLDVLQRFVELGSGFQVASYDLEIRGGGNLLGAEQSGHIASVGLDLFTEMLEEAIQELKGNPASLEEKHFEPEIQSPVPIAIPGTFVTDSTLRIQLYRRLSNTRTNEQVDQIQAELFDRFGEPPNEVLDLLWLIRIKNLLRKVGVDSLQIGPSQSKITVRKTSLIDPDACMKLYLGPKSIRDSRVKLLPDSRIEFHIPFEGMRPHLFTLEGLFQKIAPKAFEIPKTH